MATVGTRNLRTMKAKSAAQGQRSEHTVPPESVTITGVLICMPTEIIESPCAESPKLGIPIMPEGFVVDSGFLPTARR